MNNTPKPKINDNQLLKLGTYEQLVYISDFLEGINNNLESINQNLVLKNGQDKEYMSSIFTKIINREFQSYIVDETDKYIEILAKDQMQPGHTLIIPKKEVDSYLELSNEEFGDIMQYAKQIATKLKKAYPNKERIIMNIVGFEVPHLHIHLIPANSIQEAFMGEPAQYNDIELEAILNQIRLK